MRGREGTSPRMRVFQSHGHHHLWNTSYLEWKMVNQHRVNVLRVVYFTFANLESASQIKDHAQLDLGE